jgi:hypothetical protein
MTFIHRRARTALLLAAAFALPFALCAHPAAAADPVPLASCSGFPTNSYQWSGGPTNAGKYYNLFCDGSIWQPNMLFDLDANIGIGLYAYSSLTTGSGNTIFGSAAGAGLTSGANNTFIGQAADYAGTAAGNQNTGLGGQALYNVRGGNNTALGFNSGASITTGSNNIILGISGNITTGSGNILIGNSLTQTTASASNQLDIGDLIYGTLGSSKVGINIKAPQVALDVSGDIQYTGLIVDVSDRRLKRDIRKLPRQAERIAKLEPVSFTMKDDPAARTELGFIAQDVEPLYPDLVVTDSKGTRSLNYIGLIAPMVAAMQEQQAEIATLKAEIAALKRKGGEIATSAPPPRAARLHSLND